MPRKLGQHFLTNQNKIKKIIDSLELEDGDTVIEIGPGKGALTKELGKRDKNMSIVAVEMDKKLIDYLNQDIVSDIESVGNSIKIRYGNILTELPILNEEIENFNKCKIVGNIPYYITGKLFRVFEELEKKPERIVLMVQKEVADRIVVNPPNMNILAASVQFWAEVSKLFNVPRKDFKPAPEVNSAVIKLIPKKYDSENAEKYYKMMKIIFKHPRKTILNNLSIGLKEEERKDLKEQLIKLEIDPGDRPQDLYIKDIKNISKSF